MTELDAMLRRRRHINGEVTPEKRDMRRELLEWREREGREARRPPRAGSCWTPTRGSDENTPQSAPRAVGKAWDENWHHSYSSPLTPAKQRGHVNAVSPLMEVCQNATRSSGEPRRCRVFALSSAVSPLREEASVPVASRSRCCHEVHCEIAVWEESIQAPSVPPPSPATPAVSVFERRIMRDNRAVQGFLHGLPATLSAAMPAEASPERRRLLACLEESDIDENEAPPSDEDDNTADAKEVAEEGVLENEQDRLRLRLQSHQLDWPPQTILDMEDFLSRSHDIDVFWFFEARDRVRHALDRTNWTAASLETISEYPSTWSQWQVESARSRSAMRARRRSTSTSGRNNVEDR